MSNLNNGTNKTPDVEPKNPEIEKFLHLKEQAQNYFSEYIKRYPYRCLGMAIALGVIISKCL